SRFYSVVGEDEMKYKAALAWLLTCRGIPELYYGDEIGMKGLTSPNDGYVRKDFPGGWRSDSLNKFTVAGRTAKEEDLWKYIATLANFRKNSSAITTGKMMQFAPSKGEYVFFRYDSKQTIMTVMNTAKEKLTIEMKNYSERTNGFSKMKNVITGVIQPLADFSLMPMESGVWELVK
ncbi:MAG: cyclomaltodextrinase C-terminal domain-containing protein, partial [Ginsengibacter sp.]